MYFKNLLITWKNTNFILHDNLFYLENECEGPILPHHKTYKRKAINKIMTENFEQSSSTMMRCNELWKTPLPQGIVLHSFFLLCFQGSTTAK